MIHGIGIIGKMRAGKDEAANFIVGKYGGCILKLADPLYEMEAAIFKIAGIPIPENKSERRQLLQFLGTAWGRETIDPDLWTKIMDNRITELKKLSCPIQVLVTDIRFPNEIDLLRKHNFNIIRITRPEMFRIAAGATNINHISETSLDDYIDFDVEILNNINNIDAYHCTVDDVYTDIQNKIFKKGIRYMTSTTSNSYLK